MKPVSTIAFVLGTVALCGAALTDFCGVIGRHLGHPIAGTIEIVRVLIVVIVSASLVMATFAEVHASVHVLIERLNPQRRALLLRAGMAAAALAFLLLSAGGFWMLAITWPLGDQTDLLHLPLTPFRTLWCVATLLAAGGFVLLAIHPKKRNDHEP